MLRIITINLAAVFLFAATGTNATSIVPVDLNDFFADPTVTVAGDGSSALMAEDAIITPVLLANDPGLGDPNVIIAGAGTSLIFDFDFGSNRPNA